MRAADGERGHPETPPRSAPRTMMDRLADRVLREISQRQLIAAGQRVLVALSAGPDSSVLLHLLVRLAPQGGWQVAAAHLHHGLRAAADDDYQKAVELARQVGVPCFTRRLDVAQLARRESLSLEQAGRRARYRFFRELARTEGFDRIALGHQQDDQAETVLLHLLQGSGPTGLAGMAWYRPPYFIRPLLSTTREEIEQYLSEWGWQPARDASNTDPAFLRNRLRHQLLPLLEKEYAPGLRRRLAQLAEVVREEDQLLEAGLDQVWPSLTVQGAPAAGGQPGWSVAAAAWDQLPDALRRRASRRLLAVARRQEEDKSRPAPGRAEATPRAVGYSAITAMSRVPLPAPVCLPGGWIWAFHPELGQYRLDKGGHPATAAGTATGICMKLPLPGEVTWCWTGRVTRVKAQVLERPPADGRWSRDLYRPHLDGDALHLQGEFAVCTWRAGDRLQPLGLAGHKKVQDLFVDAKIPIQQRLAWPIVYDEEGIIWVPGLALAQRVRIRPTTRHWVQLEWAIPPSSAANPTVL